MLFRSIGLSVGMVAPDIEVFRMDGTAMKLSDLRGKKVFLNFWATWCPPCQAEMPDIEKMYQTYGEDLEIVAVSHYEAKETVRSFLNSNLYSFPIYLDENAMAAKPYQIISIPNSYFIDQAGVIQVKSEGMMNYGQMEQSYKKL